MARQPRTKVKTAVEASPEPTMQDVLNAMATLSERVAETHDCIDRHASTTRDFIQEQRAVNAEQARIDLEQGQRMAFIEHSIGEVGGQMTAAAQSIGGVKTTIHEMDMRLKNVESKSTVTNKALGLEGKTEDDKLSVKLPFGGKATVQRLAVGIPAAIVIYRIAEPILAWVFKETAPFWAHVHEVLMHVALK